MISLEWPELWTVYNVPADELRWVTSRLRWMKWPHWKGFVGQKYKAISSLTEQCHWRQQTNWPTKWMDSPSIICMINIPSYKKTVIPYLADSIWFRLDGLCIIWFEWIIHMHSLTIVKWHAYHDNETSSLLIPLNTDCLTQWGRGKMAAIFQMAFSNAFSWKQMYKFRLIFHWSLFPRVQLTIFQHWFR